MTICNNFFDFNSFAFWISTIISLAILFILVVYLPFKRIKSKNRYWLLCLFLILSLGAIFLSLGIFALHSNCEDIGRPYLVKDYEREITSKKDAIKILQDYITTSEFNTLKWESDHNNSYLQNQIDSIPENIIEENDKYVVTIRLTEYNLYKNGKLYLKRFSL